MVLRGHWVWWEFHTHHPLPSHTVVSTSHFCCVVGFLWFRQLGELILSIRRVVIGVGGACRSLTDACFLDACVFLSLCAFVSNYRAENTPHSLRPHWLGRCGPWQTGPTGKGIFSGHRAQISRFRLRLLLLFVKSERLWNELERRGKKNRKTFKADWATAGVCGRHTHTHTDTSEKKEWVYISPVG